VVQVTLEEGVLLRSALLMYMLPLVFLLGGAVVGAHWADGTASSEIFSALGGFTGLALGFAMAKVMALRRSLASVATPVIMSSEI